MIFTLICYLEGVEDQLPILVHAFPNFPGTGIFCHKNAKEELKYPCHNYIK